MYIRKAKESDLSRIAEILVFNNRINFFPIFHDEQFSFGEMQVITLANGYFKQDEVFCNTYVYDDGLIRGFMQLRETEIVKLYVDPFFQSRGAGEALIEYAVSAYQADFLWALEKNTRGISFYSRHGFFPTEERKFEEGTTEYLVKLRRQGSEGKTT